MDPPFVFGGLFAVCWLLVGAAANVPVIDDWVYAWSVENFLETHHLQILQISAIYPLAHELWGIVFASAFGFSFTVLRLSTVVLAIAGCTAVYLTLLEMQCRRSTALLGGFALALQPVFFALSFSFMTEVPFIALTSWGFYFSARAIRRGEPMAFWAAAACSIVAFLVRPIAIALPAALGLSALWTRDWACQDEAARVTRREAWRRTIPTAFTAAAVMVLLQLALPRAMGPLDGTEVRYGFLEQWSSVGLGSYARWTGEVVIVAMFPMLPLWLAQLTTWRRAIGVAIAAVLLAAVCRWGIGYFVNPLPNWDTWSLQDIGGARALVGGDLQRSGWSAAIEPLMKIIGLVAAGGLLVIAVRAWSERRRWRGDELMIGAWVLLNIALIHALWFYNDRYYVVFAPAFAIVGARAIDHSRLGKSIAAALLVVWAAIGITGTRDLLAFNTVLADTARELEASGIPPWQIDAGYSVNGWRLYAHPEHLKPGSDRRYAVPFVTSADITPYSISSSPLPNSEVIRVLPLPRATWQASRELYLLRRHPQ